MNKVLAVLSMAVLAVTLVACGGDRPQQQQAGAAQEAAAEVADVPETADAPETSDETEASDTEESASE